MKTLRIVFPSFLLALALSFSISNTHAAVTIRADSALFVLPVDYNGVNFDGRWDNDAGSVGSLNALRRAGVKFLRFPGGVVANYYDWQNPGTDWAPSRFWTYTKAIGAKALFTTNAIGGGGTDSTSKHAADWVTFCKDSSIDVAYWEIGNEPDLEAVGPKNAFTQRFNSQADAMRAADPTVKIMGPGGTLLNVFAADCSSHTDFLSWHWYGGATNWTNTTGVAQGWQSIMATLKARISKPVFVSEWSVLSPTLGGVQGDWNLTVGPALASTDCIGMFAKTGVIGHTMFCIHTVQNGWGLLYNAVDYNPLDFPNPNFFSLVLWNHMGNRVLFASSPAIARTQLTVYAHTKGDTSLQVLLINKMVTARTDTLIFKGYSPIGARIDKYELKAANGSPSDIDIFYNGVSNPLPATEELPGPTSLGICADNPYIVTLPPYSATILDFQGVSGIRKADGRKAGIAPIQIQRIAYSKQGISIVLTKSIACIDADVSIRALSGRIIERLAPKTKENSFEYVWDKAGHAPGTYLVSVKSADAALCRTVVLP